MPDGASDEELIAGCLRQDGASWDEFVGRFAGLVHWSIRNSLGQAPPGGRDEFCREVFQDFFRRLLERDELSKLREVKSVRKYLSVSACHLTMDRLKSVSRHAKKTETLDDLLAEPGSEPSTDASAWDGVLKGALEELSPKERACIEFYFVEAKTAREIGGLLGMPENTVSAIVRRTKEKLKKRLIEKGYEP